MPGKSGPGSGRGTGRTAGKAAPFPHIVFVTAYDEYAVAAFEHAAADYVLKPVNDARLAQDGGALARAPARRRQRAAPTCREQLAQMLAQLPRCAAGGRA